MFGLGEDLAKVENQTYTAYRRMQNYACLVPPKKANLLVYLKAEPTKVDLVPGFARDVTGLGHHLRLACIGLGATCQTYPTTELS